MNRRHANEPHPAGSGNAPTTVEVLVPPVLVRTWKATPLPAVTTTAALMAPAARTLAEHDAGLGPRVGVR